MASKASLRGFVLERVLRLSKTTSSGTETQSLELDIAMDGTDVSLAVWKIEASSVPFWLSLPLYEGVIGAMNLSGSLLLTASTSALAESLITPYKAVLNLSVASQRDTSFLVRVELYVSAPTLASTSIWGLPTGHATDGRVCQGDALSNASNVDPIKVVLGQVKKIQFTACDVDSLAVDHDDEGSFNATLMDRSSGTNHSLQVTYENRGRHFVLLDLSERRLGEFGLRLSFNNGQVGIERAVQAICPPGQVELSGGVSCGCTAGEFLNEVSANVLVCEPCEIAEYCPEGATIGTRCPISSNGAPLGTNGRGAKSRDECGCPTGTYNVDGGLGFVCKPCNDDMDCTRTGLTLANVPVRPSRWRLSNRTAAIYECTSSACLGGNWSGTSAGYCAPGHDGPRCEWCLDSNLYFNAKTTTCEDCGNMGGYAIKQIVLVLAVAIALGLISRGVLLAPRLLARVARRVAQAATSIQQFGLQSKYKCLLNFYQVYSVRYSVYGFELPGEMRGVMGVFEAFSFDIAAFIFPSWTCLGGLAARVAFSGLWPLVLMLAVALALVAREKARKGSIQTAALRSLEIAILVSFSVLPSVTRSLFLAFQCETFGYDDLSSPPESKTYLLASLNVECNSADHVPIYATAWIFIVLWPLALPLLYALLLYRCRRDIRNHQPTTLSRAIRFLWGDYTDSCFWFEIWETVQKLVLTNAVLFVNIRDGGSNRLLRLFVGLLIAVFGLMVQLALQPFCKRTDNAIASMVRLMLVLFFIMGIMVKLCDTDGANAIHNLLDAQIAASDFCFMLVGVPTAYGVAGLMVCVGLLAILVPLGMLIRELAISQALPVLRDARTMEPPVLLLGAGKRYHLFLSHVWSTGQDQCAVIKRQLQLLLPGVVIFLDVDDLGIRREARTWANQF